jgi:hypothetical protein
VVEEEGEGTGFCRVVPRAPPPPSIKTKNDKGVNFWQDLALGLGLDMLGKPFGRFAKEEKEREKNLQGLWYAWPGSKFKFESL